MGLIRVQGKCADVVILAVEGDFSVDAHSGILNCSCGTLGAECGCCAVRTAVWGQNRWNGGDWMFGQTSALLLRVQEARDSGSAICRYRCLVDALKPFVVHR